MSSNLQGFPWRFAVCFIAACWLFADLYACKGPLHARLMQGRGSWPEGLGGGYAAAVHGRPITRLELEEAMRAHLWARNESWAALGAEARQQIRWLVLDNLVNDRLIRAHRLMDGANTMPPTAAARREADFIQRQFAVAAEYPQRLAAQQQTQKSLDAAIRDAQLDEEWITQKIAHRLAEVTEKEVRAWYSEFKESLRIPQAHHAAHIFLTRHDQTKPDRAAEIRAIHRQLMAKEKTFAALAAEHSDDDRSKVVGGDLGWFTRERMPEDFIAAVEKLKIGQFSDPVPTKLGWHLIIVMERRASRLPTFEEAKAEISALLTSQRRAEAVKSLVAELRQTARESLIHHSPVIDRAEPAP
ncbi:MAG: peptidylprolyl isomerase [Prosthecobacter sp.]|uniref:peptidylprolyl isomerase n=1 Tax=Prosthecobacter sp. TaxID=1965333 RepID=UPI003901EA46